MSGPVTYSLEKDNYSRVGQGLGIAAKALQDVLEYYVPHTKLLIVIDRYHYVWRLLDKQQTKLVKQCTADGYKDFDIPLTYKLLRNVCTDLNDPNKPNLPHPTRGWEKVPHKEHVTLSDDIERLRLLRNSMHSYGAKAAIPETEYREKWQKLKDICGRIQSHVNKDYVSALSNLETYKLNDLQLKDLISQLQGTTSDKIGDKKITDAEIKELQKNLLDVNMAETMRIPISPLQKKKQLSLEQLYVPVVIREDLEYTSQRVKLTGVGETKQQPISTPRDMFYIDSKPARYVFLQGEAARGKTVFCLKLLWHWCRTNRSSSSASNITLPIWRACKNFLQLSWRWFRGSPSTSSARYITLPNWDTCMNEFEFMFLVQLRHVSVYHADIVDMICYNVFGDSQDCHDTIRHVLSSQKHRCLIIIDGLDEWYVSPEVRKKLKYKDLPNLTYLSNCSVLFTSRPWKLEETSDIIRSNDRVLEILGLESGGIEIIIQNVLEHFFEMDTSSREFKEKVEEIVQKSQNTALNSILKIPLMATASVHLWYTNAEVGKSMTSFYIALLRLLIERTLDDKTIDADVIENVKLLPSSHIDIPDCFQHITILKDFIPLLCKLGELGYRDQVIFDTEEIKDRIGEPALQFALITGLLCPSEAHGKLNVNFFHNTVKEFLTAMHIVSNKQFSIQSSLQHLGRAETIMEFENVLTFISGLSPLLASVISHHIVKVINSDADVRRFRESLHFRSKNKVKLIYTLQLRCLRELQQIWQDTSLTTQQDYHISDVYVDRNSDMGTVHMTADVLCNHNSHIVSLYIRRVPNNRQHGITDDVINDFLHNTTTLQSLYINGSNTRTLHTINTVRSLKALILSCLNITLSLLYNIAALLHNNSNIRSLGFVYITYIGSREISQQQTFTTSFCGVLHTLLSCKLLSQLHISYMLNIDERKMLVSVLPNLPHLKCIGYYGSTYYRVDDGDYDYTIAHMLSQWTQLGLTDISLGNKPLTLATDMDHIHLVVLYYVDISAEGWDRLVTSITNIQHQFDVELHRTNISSDCVTRIRSSPHFKVTHHNEGKSELEFTRKLPPSS